MKLSSEDKLQIIRSELGNIISWPYMLRQAFEKGYISEDQYEKFFQIQKENISNSYTINHAIRILLINLLYNCMYVKNPSKVKE